MTEDLITHLAGRLRSQLGIVQLHLVTSQQALHALLPSLPAHHAALQLLQVAWQPTSGLRHRAHIQLRITLAQQGAAANAADSPTRLLTALAGYSYVHDTALPHQRYYALTPLRLRSTSHHQHGAQRHYSASFSTEYTLVLPAIPLPA